MFSTIARLFDANRVASVVDYAESGKSTTVAEYAALCDSEVFWFTVFDETSSDDTWLTIFSLSLSAKLGAPTLRMENLAQQIAALDRTLLIVLDDAHRIQDFQSLSLLLTAVRSNTSVSLLLVGIDVPDFVSTLRSNGVGTTRIPGLSELESRTLFGIPPEQTTLQTVALNSLRGRCGGHIGLLRLGWSDIRALKTEDECIQYLADLPEGGGIGLEAMHAALVERLRSGLLDDEALLCRRLSLVITTFRRTVGEALWSIDREFSTFASVWGRCTRKVFEGAESGRYAIPEIYETGFRRELSTEEKTKLHGVIADAMQDHETKSVDYFDVHAAVFHRFLSGDIDGAMHAASMYVSYARGPGARHAKIFFLRRFDSLFSSVGESTYNTGFLQWHTTRARSYDELGDDEKASMAATKLHRILVASEKAEKTSMTPESLQLAWLAVLLYGAKHADPDLALESISKIDRSKPHRLPKLPVRWDAFLVLSACLPSDNRILPYLESVLSTSADESFDGWYETEAIYAYEFWRVVASRLYGDFRERLNGDRDSDIDALESIIEVFWKKGAGNIAAILECTLVRVEIDFRRDFAAAETHSLQLLERAESKCDQEVQVHVLQTRADALRCSDRDAEAIAVYQAALDLQPESDWSEEADLYLLIAISQAKDGQWLTAVSSAAHSGDLFSKQTDGDASLTRLAAAKSWLEAAGFAIHGESYFRAARLLIQTYSALNPDHQDDPLWAALAQISWSLVNRIAPESQDPQPPIPGFTIKLQETDESKNMQRSAVPLMLGRVCTAVGRPFRAIRYFDKAIQGSQDFDNKSSGAFYGIEAAILAEDIAAAARFATLTSDWILSRSDGNSARSHAYVYNYLLGRTFRIISKQIGSVGFDGRLGEAIQQARLASKGGPAESTFLACLEALQQALDSNDWGDLEDVFHACEECQASWLAKEIAWIACYRCTPTRITEGDFFIWQWRVMRWSLVVGENDPAYTKDVFEQQRNYWLRIPIDGRSKRVSRIIQAMETETADASGLQQVIKILAREAIDVLPLESAVQEIVSQLSMPGGESLAVGAVEELSLRFLDRCLDPVAYAHAQLLVDLIQTVLDALAGKPNLLASFEEFTDLLSLASVLNGEELTTRAYKAVRRVTVISENMTPDSAAQGFVYLRHWLRFAPDGFGYEEIVEVLSGPRVKSLVAGGELSDFMNIRLVVAHLTSIAFGAQRRLSNALARIGAQIQMRTPVLQKAIVNAQIAAEFAMRDLESVIDDLEIAAAQAKASKFNVEEWSALFELGGVLQMLGVTLVRLANDDSAVDSYIRRAIGVFRRSIAAVPTLEKEQDAEMIAKAAFPGRTLAKELNDDASLRFFQEAIDRIEAASRFDGVVERNEESEKYNILNVLNHPTDATVEILTDEEFDEYAERLVDHMMQSTGWPADRRQNVEDDVRKLRVLEQERTRFCKHLEPLQDLRHTQHPDTVYATPTEYVIRCALLGSVTRIGVTDMGLAISNMKSNYCEGCQHREPLPPPD